MKFIQFTDFRNHSKTYFDYIEKGEAFIIIRKGKPIAQILPFDENELPLKRSIQKIKLKNNVTTTEYIIKERRER